MKANHSTGPIRTGKMGKMKREEIKGKREAKSKRERERGGGG